LRQYFSITYLAVSAGFLILLKVFLFPDCLSFDTHDDANHAFPNLFVAQKMLLSGVLPTVNYYNNFGVPLLGDGLTYPFGIQTLIYYFFDGPIGMTINRFFISVGTVAIFFFFFSFYLKKPTALICSGLAFFIPISFWYPVHHYQMATFFGFLLISLGKIFFERPKTHIFLIIFIVWAIMIVSVSINHVILFVPFWLTWCFCLNNFRLNSLLFVPLITMAAGMVFSSVQTFDFFYHFLESARVSEGVYDSVLTNFRELLMGILIPPGEWLSYNYGAQLQVSTYISAPIIISILSGIFLKSSWHDRRLSLAIILCGIVPTCLALFLYITPELRLRLPLIKSGDITRVLWFSIPFCYLSLGLFFESLLGKNFKGKFYILLVILAVLLFIFRTPEFSDISNLHVISLILFGLGLLFSIKSDKISDTKRNETSSKICFFFVTTSVLLSALPTATRILGLNTGHCGGTQYSANVNLSGFYPIELLDTLQTGQRLAAEIPTYLGHDLRLSTKGLLGSGARAIVVDHKFGKYLEEKNLVTVDQVPYGYFFSRPWVTKELSKLGIRYLLVKRAIDYDLEELNWSKVTGMSDFSVYENPEKPTPISIRSANDESIIFLNDYIISNNEISIKIPRNIENNKLVIAMLNRKGYRIFLDEREIGITSDLGGFISVTLPEETRLVKLVHQPYRWFTIIFSVLLSFLMIFVSWYLVLHRQSKSLALRN